MVIYCSIIEEMFTRSKNSGLDFVDPYQVLQLVDKSVLAKGNTMFVYVNVNAFRTQQIIISLSIACENQQYFGQPIIVWPIAIKSLVICCLFI